MIECVAAAWPIRGVRVYTTTRHGGVSRGPYASLNLGTHVGDSPEDVLANRMRVREALRLPSVPRWLNQIHGSRVIDARAINQAVDADGSFTSVPRIVCAVLTADCLPIVLADRKARCIAALHGGWRGLAAGVIEAGVAALAVPPSNVVAWLGPAIGARHYEVGESVRTAFGDGAQIAFRAIGAGRYQADLYALARIRLAACGISEVYGGGFDTLGDPRFYSYRETQVCGRMATLAWIEGDSP